MDMTEERREFWQEKLNPLWISTQDGTLRFRKEQATDEFLQELKDMGYTPTFTRTGQFEIHVIC